MLYQKKPKSPEVSPRPDDPILDFDQTLEEHAGAIIVATKECNGLITRSKAGLVKRFESESKQLDPFIYK